MYVQLKCWQYRFAYVIVTENLVTRQSRQSLKIKNIMKKQYFINTIIHIIYKQINVQCVRSAADTNNIYLMWHGDPVTTNNIVYLQK